MILRPFKDKKKNREDKPVPQHINSSTTQTTPMAERLSMSVLCLLSETPKSPAVIKARDRAEYRWMRHIQSITPDGLNWDKGLTHD